MTKKKNFSKHQSNLYRIAIYTRVSTEEQTENPEGSIKTQEQRIREYVDLKNRVDPFGEVISVYSDPGKSAKDMNRPGFQRMLTAIKQNEITMVIVTELSRFSRSTKDFAMLQEFLAEHDCKFLSLRENFDTSGAAGSMVMSLMATIAEFERRQTAERISSAFLARAKRGLYNGGSLPLGYRIDPHKPGYLFIDPIEAEIVKLAFSEFLKQQTLAATAKHLTSLGIRLPRKVQGSGSVRVTQFKVDSLYRLLKNKVYIGIKVFSSKNGLDEVPAVWEPIIDRELFDRVGALLAKNCHHKRTHGSNRYPYTLSGLIFCSQCGDRMSGKSAHGRGGKVGYYEHIKTTRMQSGSPVKLETHKPHRVPSIKIEPLVWQAVKKFIMSDKFAGDLLEKAKVMQSSATELDELALARGKMKTTEGQIAVLAERISALPKEVSAKPLIDQMGRLQVQKREQEALLLKFETREPVIDKPMDLKDLGSFRKVLKKLIEGAEFNNELQAKIIKTVVHKIIVTPHGCEIFFHVGQSHYLNFKGKLSQAGGPIAAEAGQDSDFFKGPGSSLLTNGDPTPT